MNPFMNMNAGMPQQNMNFNQDLFQQFTHIYNNNRIHATTLIDLFIIVNHVLYTLYEVHK